MQGQEQLSQGPYAYNKQEWVGYDDEEMTARKVQTWPHLHKLANRSSDTVQVAICP